MTLEFERRGLRTFIDLADAQHVIGNCFDGFYNTERVRSTIDDASPVEYELMSALAA